MVEHIDDYRLNARGELTAQWPPQPVWERIQWLNELRDAYDGIPQLSDKFPGPTLRWCQWACKQHAEYLTSSPPMLNSRNVTAQMAAAAVDMCRYGGALLWPDGDSLMVLDPRWWVPTEDGWFYLVPQVSETNRIVDHAVLWQWTADEDGNGQVAMSAHPFSGAAGSDTRSQSVGGSIDIDSGVSVLLGEDGAPTTAAAAELIVIPMLPMRGQYWGTPLIEAGVPFQEMAQARWAGIRHLSEVIEDPLLTYREASADTVQIANEPADDGSDSDGEGSAATNLRAFSAVRRTRLEDQVQQLHYVQPQLDARSVGTVLETLRNEFEAATATTGLRADPGGGDGRSGVAIKWQHAGPLQASFSIQNQIRQAIEDHYGDGALKWPHPTDALDRTLNADGTDPQPPTPDDNDADVDDDREPSDD